MGEMMTIPPGYPDDVELKISTGYNPTPWDTNKACAKMTEKKFWIAVRAGLLAICAAIEQMYLRNNTHG